MNGSGNFVFGYKEGSQVYQGLQQNQVKTGRVGLRTQAGGRTHEHARDTNITDDPIRSLSKSAA